MNFIFVKQNNEHWEQLYKSRFSSLVVDISMPEEHTVYALADKTGILSFHLQPLIHGQLAAA